MSYTDIGVKDTNTVRSTNTISREFWTILQGGELISIRTILLLFSMIYFKGGASWTTRILQIYTNNVWK